MLICMSVTWTVYGAVPDQIYDTVTFQLNGMHSNNVAYGALTFFKRLSGVKNIHVCLQQGTITFDMQGIDFDEFRCISDYNHLKLKEFTVTIRGFIDSSGDTVFFMHQDRKGKIQIGPKQQHHYTHGMSATLQGTVMLDDTVAVDQEKFTIIPHAQT